MSFINPYLPNNYNIYGQQSNVDTLDTNSDTLDTALDTFGHHYTGLVQFVKLVGNLTVLTRYLGFMP